MSETDDPRFDYVTDTEIVRRLNVPEKIGRRAIRDLEKQAHGRPKFPAKDPLFGERRFWPSVRKYFMLRNGVTDEPFLAAPYHQEKPNETAQTGETRRLGNAGVDVETARQALDSLLDSTARPRRRRLSHQGPKLVASVERSESDPDAE